MSSLALMRMLEGSPSRYDAGMRWITLGRVDEIHDAVAEAVNGAVATASPSDKSSRVLEIGCGTGAVTERLVRAGHHVTAIDQNPAMLDQARSRLGAEAVGTDQNVSWDERTASEIDSFPEASFDAVVASLSLSEMTATERAFVLAQAAARLRVGGRLIVADELRPAGFTSRMIYNCLRGPQALAGWILAGTVSHPIENLAAEIEATGLQLVEERHWLADSLGVLVAERRES